MRFIDFLRFDSARTLVRKQLVPGRVIHYPIQFPQGVEPKFVILAALREEHFHVFVISSERSRFVLNRPRINAQHVGIDVASHTEFLKRDSVIDCSELRPLPVSDVESRLAKNPGDVKCCISAAVRGQILETVQKFGSLSDTEKKAVADYLGAAL